MPFITGTAITTAAMSAATQAAAMSFAVGADIAIASVAGAGLSAYGAYGAGQQQKATAEYNAQVAENQAIRERQAAGYQAELQAREGRGLKGRQRAAYAKAGVTGAGSPLLVLEDTANLIQQDIQITLWGGRQRAGHYRGQARLSRMRGKSAYKAGIIGAGSSLLSGAADTAYRYKTMKT